VKESITYRFRFSDGSEAVYPSPVQESSPDHSTWTALSFHQCPNCPLTAGEQASCPLAVQLAPIVDLAGGRTSQEEVKVEVSSPERTYSRTTSLQGAVGSLMGLLCATSDCPHMSFLSSLARFHLPFANEKETIYRVLGNYLVQQLLLQEEGETPDWEIHELRKLYEEVGTVNRHMANRLRAASDRDAAVNALVILDSLARALRFTIDEDFRNLKTLLGDDTDKSL